MRDLSVSLGGPQGLPAQDDAAGEGVNGVSLDIYQGEILALVGESGSGKTTLGRTILGLQREDEGDILLDGRERRAACAQAAPAARDAIQYVHQDAGASARSVVEHRAALWPRDC